MGGMATHTRNTHSSGRYDRIQTTILYIFTFQCFPGENLSFICCFVRVLINFVLYRTFSYRQDCTQRGVSAWSAFLFFEIDFWLIGGNSWSCKSYSGDDVIQGRDYCTLYTAHWKLSNRPHYYYFCIVLYRFRKQFHHQCLGWVCRHIIHTCMKHAPKWKMDWFWEKTCIFQMFAAGICWVRTPPLLCHTVSSQVQSAFNIMLLLLDTHPTAVPHSQLRTVWHSFTVRMRRVMGCNLFVVSFVWLAWPVDHST